MIRFIILLPIKLIGLLFMLIGAVLDGATQRKAELAKQAEYERRVIEKNRKEEERRIRAAQVATERANRAARIEHDRAERKAKQDKAEKFKREQAEKDYYHYMEQLRETVKVYNELQKAYDEATGDKRTTIYRKIIGINQSMRNIERNMEKAKFAMGISD